MPLLLRVLRDPDWYLNRNASMLAGAQAHRRRIHRPVLEYFLDKAEREDAIAKFNDWWRAEEKRLEKERRG